MKRPKPRIPARYLTDEQVRQRLNCSRKWFKDNKKALYMAGMPQPDPLVGGKTDRKALEAWADRRSGLVAQLPRPEAGSADPASERVTRLYGDRRA